MNAMKLIMASACVACLSLTASTGFAAQSLNLTESTKITDTRNLRPIQARGQAFATLKADMMSVNISMAALGDNMNQIIQNLQARRDELSGKVGSGSLNVVRTEISSLNIRKQSGNTPGYRGEVQLTVEISGFDDPLSAIAQIADENVSRVSNLRYAFSEGLLKQTDLCDIALTDARNKAVKRAEASGHKLGKLVDHQCNDHHLRQRGYSSQATREVNVNATATFERAE